GAHRDPADHPDAARAVPVRLRRQDGAVPMSVETRSRTTGALTECGSWLLALVWISPLLYAFWTAFHPAAFAARFDLAAPWTLENLGRVWSAAPFARYFLNTFMLVSLILACQLVVCTLAAFAFVYYPFR